MIFLNLSNKRPGQTEGFTPFLKVLRENNEKGRIRSINCMFFSISRTTCLFHQFHPELKTRYLIAAKP